MRTQLCPDTVAQHAPTTKLEAPAAAAKPATVVPLAPAGYKVEFTASLMCRAHNLYMAELDYDKEKMDRYRRTADQVREPSSSFEGLFPNRSRGSTDLTMAGPVL